jgi:serine/threonine protein kinase
VGLTSFNVIERLGKGSFGSVYLVEKKSSKSMYAMKVLEKSKVLKQNLVRYAMTERNVLCLAAHPFIVSLNYAF